MQPISASPSSGAAQGGGHNKLIALTMSLFFAFGFCTVLVDSLIPKLKAMFSLSYAEVMLTQFCFFMAYFIISAPAGWLMTKIGYLRGVVVGLAVMAAGCLLFTPAANLGVYGAFLGALFILASGVTVVQVAANPLAAAAGDPSKSHARLTLAQAFNSLATTVGPFFGAHFILKNTVEAPAPGSVSPAVLEALRKQEAGMLQGPFMAIAAAVLLLAALCWIVRGWAPKIEQAAGKRTPYAKLLKNKRLVLGAASIFTYVGAEVAIGSAITNYLMQTRVLGLPIEDAGRLVAVYWGLAMVGRFLGSWVLSKVKAGKVLMFAAAGACTLAVVSGLSAGMVAAVTILAIGFCNSIMFPTIFTIAIEEMGEDAPQGSGILAMAIVGGAIVPFVFGVAADHLGLSLALIVPAVCYVWIAAYGWLTASGKVPALANRETLGQVLG